MDYFMMSAEVAEEFFNRCLMKEAITEKERLDVMKELMAEKKLMMSGRTELSKEEFAKTLANKGANVLVVKGKQRKPRINLDFKQEDSNG